MEVGGCKEASECFEHAISRSFFQKQSPSQHWIHLGSSLPHGLRGTVVLIHGLGVACYYLHDFKKAIRCVQAAHKANPDDVRPYPILARALHASGEFEASLKVYDAYIALIKIEWVYYLKATVLYDLKQYEYDYAF